MGNAQIAPHHDFGLGGACELHELDVIAGIEAGVGARVFLGKSRVATDEIEGVAGKVFEIGFTEGLVLIFEKIAVVNIGCAVAFEIGGAVAVEAGVLHLFGKTDGARRAEGRCDRGFGQFCQALPQGLRRGNKKGKVAEEGAVVLKNILMINNAKTALCARISKILPPEHVAREEPLQDAAIRKTGQDRHVGEIELQKKGERPVFMAGVSAIARPIGQAAEFALPQGKGVVGDKGHGQHGFGSSEDAGFVGREKRGVEEGVHEGVL